MFDGFKIDVPISAKVWFENPRLDFYTYTNTKTGELLDGTLVAKYRGLKFFIIQSVKYSNKTYCTVRGSLHKYLNKGKHNANDFTIEDLQTVLVDLQNKFSINPETAILRNIEFGVNINTPVTATELLKNLVSYGNYQFGKLSLDSIVVGKSINQQRNDLKIYDKGKQLDMPVQNLTRIEIAVKKMVFLKPYDITTLADLTNIAKIKPLGGLLVSYWNDIIYYDKKVNWKQLSPFERKKLLYYATPRNWQDFNRMQRYRAKQHFSELMQKYSPSTTHKKISDLIGAKVASLTAVFCRRINHDLQIQNVDELTVRIHGYNVDKSNTEKNTMKPPTKTPLKSTHKTTHFCKTCKTDISHKKPSALYCCKKCNNSYHASKRKQKRHERKKVETEALTKLLKKLSKTNYRLLVEYRTAGIMYAETLYQNEINTTYNWIRQVTRVTIQTKKPIVLTSYRAKKLIHEINKQNIKLC